MLRHIAKNIVANGYAKKNAKYKLHMQLEKNHCQFTLTHLELELKQMKKLVKLIQEKFDLTPNGIIEYLGLKNQYII